MNHEIGATSEEEREPEEITEDTEGVFGRTERA
jgi:hypothetical protein